MVVTLRAAMRREAARSWHRSYSSWLLFLARQLHAFTLGGKADQVGGFAAERSTSVAGGSNSTFVVWLRQPLGEIMQVHRHTDRIKQVRLCILVLFREVLCKLLQYDVALE